MLPVKQPFAIHIKIRTFVTAFFGIFENDEETGRDHFEARDYDSRIARWLNPDPAKQFFSPYLAMGNNPVSRVDPDGRFWQEFGNWLSGDGWKPDAAVDFANAHPNWTWNSDNNNFYVGYKETALFELGGAGVSPTFGPVNDFYTPRYRAFPNAWFAEQRRNKEQNKT